MQMNMCSLQQSPKLSSSHNFLCSLKRVLYVMYNYVQRAEHIAFWLNVVEACCAISISQYIARCDKKNIVARTEWLDPFSRSNKFLSICNIEQLFQRTLEASSRQIIITSPICWAMLIALDNSRTMTELATWDREWNVGFLEDVKCKCPANVLDLERSFVRHPHWCHSFCEICNSLPIHPSDPITRPSTQVEFLPFRSSSQLIQSNHQFEMPLIWNNKKLLFIGDDEPYDEAEYHVVRTIYVELKSKSSVSCKHTKWKNGDSAQFRDISNSIVILIYLTTYRRFRRTIFDHSSQNSVQWKILIWVILACALVRISRLAMTRTLVWQCAWEIPE